MQTPEQKANLASVGQGLNSVGALDFVAAWYLKAGQLLEQHPNTRVAFVSTNSITQGEQVAILWAELVNRYDLDILFAHRTFKWNNEARGNAAVYCIIVGLARQGAPGARQLFDYATPTAAPQRRQVAHINPYLIDAPTVFIPNRSRPLSPNVPPMIWGNKPSDGGHLILSAEERAELLAAEPGAAPWIRQYAGGDDLINNKVRYCLWLRDISPSELRALPGVLARVEAVRQMRATSKAPSTQKKAATPTLFVQIAQPDSDYLAIPEVSSERRRYIPVAFLSKEIIASNTVQLVPNATPYFFGMLTSEMHMTWMRQICGRLKSDFRYSNSLVYNNYPFPLSPTPAQTAAVEAAAEAVLAARARFPQESLAALYDPRLMPPALAQAHAALDRAVDKCYRPAPFATELSRLEHLFGLYQQLSAPLLEAGPAKKRRQPPGGRP